MYDYKPIDHDAIREKIAGISTYWERQPTDNPHTLNGFAGTWNFSNHRLIPEDLRDFIFESFPKHEKFRRIPIEEINALMNDVWEGPGSMVKVQNLLHEMRRMRNAGLDPSKVKMDDVKTINDYSDGEMTGKVVD